MEKMKKGVLFTVGITGMMLIIVTFSLIIYNNAINSKEISSQTGVIERISDIEISVKESMKDIFEFKANITVDVSNNVVFRERIPNTGSHFTDSMEDFMNYVQEEFSDSPEIKINITKVTEELPLIIKPHGITYSHTDGFGERQLSVRPEEYNFNAYELDIDGLGKNLASFDIDNENTCVSGDRCNILTIIVNDNLQYNQSIDMDKKNKYILKFAGNNIVEINLETPGTLIVDNKGSTIDLKTKIYLDKFNDERIKVDYPENMIEVDLKTLNVFKTGTVTVAY